MECGAKNQLSDNASVLSENSEEVARVSLVDGCQCEQRQDWDGAIASYQRAVGADPQDSLVRYFAHNNLGYSLLQLGRFDEAEEYCEAAIAINPAQYNAHKNIGLAYEGQGRWLDAALSLAEAARLCPENTRAWIHLQHLLMKQQGLLRQSKDLADLVIHLKGLYRVLDRSSKPH
jgi:tetratricopeptide (TPR) repeat protein